MSASASAPHKLELELAGAGAAPNFWEFGFHYIGALFLVLLFSLFLVARVAGRLSRFGVLLVIVLAGLFWIEVMAEGAAWRLDQGLDALREATLAVGQVRKVALEVADGAVQVFGGHGYIRDYLPEMHLRNARGLSSFECLAMV